MATKKPTRDVPAIALSSDSARPGVKLPVPTKSPIALLRPRYMRPGIKALMQGEWDDEMLDRKKRQFCALIEDIRKDAPDGARQLKMDSEGAEHAVYALLQWSGAVDLSVFEDPIFGPLPLIFHIGHTARGISTRAKEHIKDPINTRANAEKNKLSERGHCWLMYGLPTYDRQLAEELEFVLITSLNGPGLANKGTQDCRAIVGWDEDPWNLGVVLALRHWDDWHKSGGTEMALMSRNDARGLGTKAKQPRIGLRELKALESVFENWDPFGVCCHVSERVEMLEQLPPSVAPSSSSACDGSGARSEEFIPDAP